MQRYAAVVLLMMAAFSLPAQTRPKNIILIIGDGMGTVHIDWAAELRKEDFRIGRLPVSGLSRTASSDRAVTDSAAGATALATGVRTKYEALAIDPKGKPLETLLEIAEKRGKATGLVTTAAFFDATVAAFAAHSDHRRNYADILGQIVTREIEVIAGGGLERLGKPEIPTASELAKRGGYTLISDPTLLADAPAGRVLAVFPTERRDADIKGARLADLTRWAIGRLQDDPDGFLLVVEHEGTDSASHNNDSELVRAALISIDEAVGVAADFAAGNGDTLVLVTADHETGGLRGTETKLGRPRYEWSTTDHTAAPVAVFAAGPGSERFSGFQLNIDVGRKLIELFR